MLWKSKDSAWEQDDAAKTFRVKEIAEQACSAEPIVPIAYLLGAKAHPSSAEACAAGVFPPDFAHCPYCGASLVEANSPASDGWIPPYGTGSGLKKYPRKLRTDHSGKVQLEAGSKVFTPAREGLFSYGSLLLGARQRLLVAIQREVGRIWVHNPEGEKKWQALAGLFGVSSLPSWSWSMATDSQESGICVPADDGPAWVSVNWATSSVVIDKYKGGRSLGGPVRLGKYILAPVSSDNRTRIVCRTEFSAGWGDCVQASGVAGSFEQQSSWGIPVVDDNRGIAYWPCRDGYVRVSLANDSADPVWEFRPWEMDDNPAIALVELGPPCHRTGSGFWQLCEDKDHTVRGGIVYKLFKLDGDSTADVEKVDCGEFLTTGEASFSWCDDHWEDVHKRQERMPDQNELSIPLLQFGEKKGLVLVAKVAPWENQEEVETFTDILKAKGKRVQALVRFVIEGSGVPEKPLVVTDTDLITGERGSLFKVEIGRLFDMSAFIYQSSLFICMPGAAECYRWPLSFQEG